MRVIATAPGLAGTVRQIGEVFDCPKNAKGEEIAKASWYKPYNEGEERLTRAQRREQRQREGGGEGSAANGGEEGSATSGGSKLVDE